MNNTQKNFAAKKQCGIRMAEGGLVDPGAPVAAPAPVAPAPIAPVAAPVAKGPWDDFNSAQKATADANAMRNQPTGIRAPAPIAPAPVAPVTPVAKAAPTPYPTTLGGNMVTNQNNAMAAIANDRWHKPQGFANGGMVLKMSQTLTPPPPPMPSERPVRTLRDGYDAIVNRLQERAPSPSVGAVTAPFVKAYDETVAHMNRNNRPAPVVASNRPVQKFANGGPVKPFVEPSPWGFLKQAITPAPKVVQTLRSAPSRLDAAIEAQTGGQAQASVAAEPPPKELRFANGGGVRVDIRNGGHMRGPGTTTSDSIPAVSAGGAKLALSTGEFVVNAKAVKMFGAENLEAINEMGLPEGEKTPHSIRDGVIHAVKGFNPLGWMKQKAGMGEAATPAPAAQPVPPVVPAGPNFPKSPETLRGTKDVLGKGFIMKDAGGTPGGTNMGANTNIPVGGASPEAQAFIRQGAPSAPASKSGMYDAAKRAMSSKAAGTVLGTAGTAASAVPIAIDSYNLSKDAEDGERVALAGEQVGRFAGVTAGAAAGASLGSAVPVVGTAIGGVLGGAAGYFAPDAVKAATDYVGWTNKDTLLPSDTIRQRRPNPIAAPTASATPAAPTAAAPTAAAAEAPTTPQFDITKLSPIEERNSMRGGLPAAEQRAAVEVDGLEAANKANGIRGGQTYKLNGYDTDAAIYGQATNGSKRINSFTGTGSGDGLRGGPTQDELVATKIAAMNRTGDLQRQVNNARIAYENRNDPTPGVSTIQSADGMTTEQSLRANHNAAMAQEQDLRASREVTRGRGRGTGGGGGNDSLGRDKDRALRREEMAQQARHQDGLRADNSAFRRDTLAEQKNLHNTQAAIANATAAQHNATYKETMRQNGVQERKDGDRLKLDEDKNYFEQGEKVKAGRIASNKAYRDQLKSQHPDVDGVQNPLVAQKEVAMNKAISRRVEQLYKAGDKRGAESLATGGPHQLGADEIARVDMGVEIMNRFNEMKPKVFGGADGDTSTNSEDFIPATNKDGSPMIDKDGYVTLGDPKDNRKIHRKHIDYTMTQNRFTPWAQGQTTNDYIRKGGK
jgi:hypothetical protein